MNQLLKEGNLISKYKETLNINVELKNIFKNSILYGKKNRFVAMNVIHNQEEPIIKGLDGLADSNPLWVRRWFNRILIEIVKNPHTRFLVIPKMLKTAFSELEQFCNKLEIGRELKFTQRLGKLSNEYHGSVRAGILAKLLEKDKGDEVYWFEVTHRDNKTDKAFSTTVPTLSEINYRAYKHLLLDKLHNTLEIAGLDVNGIRLELLQNTLPIDSELYREAL
jgi:hypothetical protein